MTMVKMSFGLLWYDADKKRPAADKIDEAVERYVEKFGDWPDTCYVHPSTPAQHPELRVVKDPVVLPHHFLLGVELEEQPSSVRRLKERLSQLTGQVSPKVPETKARKRSPMKTRQPKEQGRPAPRTRKSG